MSTRGLPRLSGEIREAFLTFFESRGHARLPSSSLVPHNDPSLLFTNAGMVQFKDRFSGAAHEGGGAAHAHASAAASAAAASSSAASAASATALPLNVTTSQKCVRAGGKHNDLDNVGYTPRHHTYFEMLGNFSFGGYFKEEAIVHAWEFVSKDLSLDPSRLRVTVHRSDDESEALWKKISGLPSDRIVRLGDEDNFWSMGDGPGPCGPCTEIFVDTADGSMGGAAVDSKTLSDDDRWLEIWNLVFMQHLRTGTWSDGHHDMLPLPVKCVDTGMGLERVSAVMQGVPNNFDTDVFTPLAAVVWRCLADRDPAAVPASLSAASPEQVTAVRVISDHLRAAAHLIADGVVPSNVGRG